MKRRFRFIHDDDVQLGEEPLVLEHLLLETRGKRSLVRLVLPHAPHMTMVEVDLVFAQSTSDAWRALMLSQHDTERVVFQDYWEDMKIPANMVLDHYRVRVTVLDIDDQDVDLMYIRTKVTLTTPIPSKLC